MHRRILPFIVFALAALACNGLTLGSAPTTSPATAAPAESTQPPSDTAPAQPGPASSDNGIFSSPLPSNGRLAVQGADGNLYVIQKDKTPIQLSSDAVPLDQNSHGLIYAHPTWSPQGWLSYVRENSTSSGSQTDLMAIPPNQSNPITILSQSAGSYIYGYWSPAACSSGDACGRFAFLLSNSDQVALHLAEVTQDKLTSEDAVGLASPFYFSWSPDGNDMLWHRNTTDLTIYDADKRQISQRLPDTGGLFQSPAWSPSDNRWLFARVEHDANQLTIANDTQRSNVGTPGSDALFFNWSPDGKYVASASGQYPLTGLTLTRADSAASIQIKSIDAVVGFFWSPDSSQLAVVNVEQKSQLPQASAPTYHARVLPQQSTNDVDLVWSLVDVATDKVTRLGSFFPTPEEFYILRYFDQYSQSHRVWSPDGRYIVYAERQSDNVAPEVELLDTLAPGQAPIQLMQGVQAIYSFGG